MTEYSDLVSECDRYNIRLAYNDLDDQVNGFFIYDGTHSTIVLANRLNDNPALRNVVLAEELGHYHTLTLNNIPCQCWSRLNRLNFDKNEARAVRWAAFRLISQDDIRTAVQDGVNTLAALAERFQVTQGLVLYRLRLPDCQIVWNE